MGMYSDLTDEELSAKIAKYRQAAEDLDIGEQVAVVAGEGRRMEFTRANSRRLLATLKALIREKDRRSGTNRNGAIEVYFG